ncbi:L-fucose:H+ symporter permease [Neptunicella sp. SCSIO 80796]|uniref:L-fucose:H+ symporter permease n=1 Tax=Neptunicella plasticusilytica TaxID=3117012 RepID=UPI003A4DFCCE
MKDNVMQRSKQAGLWCTVLVISLFFLWGFANNLNDILVQQFKKTFTLSDFQSGLVQSAFYLGYFFCAIPAAAVMQKFGYKTAIVVGLFLYSCGALLFYPAAEVQLYSFFLAALFVIASGLTFLETSANPYIVVMGDRSTAQRRLNFAQSFNPLGSISGVLIGQHFIFTGVEYSAAEFEQLSGAQQQAFFDSEALAVQMPYLVLGSVILCWCLLFVFTRFKEHRPHPDTGVPADKASYRTLFSYRHFRSAAFAQFCYVGAQVGVWSFIIRYTLQADPDLTEKLAANALTASLVLFMLGRFIGTWLMSRIEGRRLMVIFAITNVFLTLGAALLFNDIGIICLVLVSFGMSIMFPTIFALGVDHVGQQTKLAASVLVMAIVGGAVLTALMGALSDVTNIQTAFLLPALSFAVIGWFGYRGYRPDFGIENSCTDSEPVIEPTV